MSEETRMTKLKATLDRRSLLARGSALAVALAVGASLAGSAFAADGVLKGKRLAYIAFGLQYEYQVTLVARVKELAAEKGMSIQVYDGKGDPSTQTTQLLDVVSKQPDIILLNPVDAKLLQGGVRKANESKIPLFMLENLPPEGDWIAYNTFDDVAGGAAGADAMAKLIGGKASCSKFAARSVPASRKSAIRASTIRPPPNIRT